MEVLMGMFMLMLVAVLCIAMAMFVFVLMGIRMSMQMLMLMLSFHKASSCTLVPLDPEDAATPSTCSITYFLV